MDAMATMRAEAHRLGGALVCVGTLAWLVLGGLHGELPSTGHHVVEAAARPLWREIHIFTIVAIALVAAGLALLGSMLTATRAAVLGRLGTALVVPAGAVLGVGFAIDGYVLAGLADLYRAAPDDGARQMALMQADMILRVVRATSFSFQTLFGLAAAVLAGAMLVSAEYPAWLCGLGLFSGGLWLIGGALLFANAAAIGAALAVVAVAPGAVWLLGCGWLAWRRGGQTHAPAPAAEFAVAEPGRSTP
ncbi:MAG TPA: hypothetical protein VFI22_06915 [Thermomicrobiales bacterium]|nr:hypothetical protein [Thermomicrobiales bacterium]